MLPSPSFSAIICKIRHIVNIMHFFIFSNDNSATLTNFSFLPESPRWLVSANKWEEAKVQLQRIARINGKREDVNVEELVEIVSTTIRIRLLSIPFTFYRYHIGMNLAKSQSTP